MIYILLVLVAFWGTVGVALLLGAPLWLASLLALAVTIGFIYAMNYWENIP